MTTTDTTVRPAREHREFTLADLLSAGYITDDIVKAAAFSSLPEEVMSVLLDDDHIIEFNAAATALSTLLQGQLAVANAQADAGDESNPKWRAGVVNLSSRVSALLVRIGPRVADRKRRSNDDNHSTDLYRAIVRHRERVTAEYDETEADIELWAVISK